MNLDNKELRELIEYASGNSHQVCICLTFAYIELPDAYHDFLSVTLFETSNHEVCIIKNPKCNDANPVKITSADFKCLFMMKNHNVFR